MKKLSCAEHAAKGRKLAEKAFKKIQALRKRKG